MCIIIHFAIGSVLLYTHIHFLKVKVSLDCGSSLELKFKSIAYQKLTHTSHNQEIEANIKMKYVVITEASHSISVSGPALLYKESKEMALTAKCNKQPFSASIETF